LVREDVANIDFAAIEVDRLAIEVSDSNLPHKDRIARLLEQAGILSTLGDT
jgi:hypothetical protein